jgi:hypothetical protein
MTFTFTFTFRTSDDTVAMTTVATGFLSMQPHAETWAHHNAQLLSAQTGKFTYPTSIVEVIPSNENREPSFVLLAVPQYWAEGIETI